MYKLSRRSNLLPFLVIVGIGLAASVAVPPHFPEQVFEIPAFALFPAEIALVMMLSVLFFENATPGELLRLSFTMLALTMLSGTLCNVAAKSSQTLPDATLLLNWVQLICMNLTGLIATIALYQTKAAGPKPQTISAREPALKETISAPVVEEGAEAIIDKDKLDPASGESAKEILEKLDISRINRLERQISAKTTPNETGGSAVSLESLFADESQAAKGKAPSLDDLLGSEQAPSLDDLLGAKAGDTGEVMKPAAEVKEHGFSEPPAEPAPAAAQAQSTAAADVAASIDDLFGDIALGGSDVSVAQAPASVEDPVATPTPPPLEAAPAEPAMPVEPALESAPAEPAVHDISGGDLDLCDMPAESAPEPVAAEASQPEPIMADSPASQPVEQAAPPADTSGKLFDESNLGGELEDIFSGLAAGAANDEFSPEKLAELKAKKTEPEAAPTPAPAAEDKPSGKLFDDVSGDIDDIFGNLAPAEAQKEVADVPRPAPTTPAAAPAAVAEAKSPEPPAPSGPPKEVKEFGRLSAAATAKTDLAAPGTLKTIGQMLLDTQAVENIIKRSENRGDQPQKTSAATAKVVSVSRGADIQAMLDKIAAFPGIDGSLVIGKDGLLIGATDSLGMMRDVLGVLSLGIHSTTNLGTKKIDMGELRQAVLRTGQKLTVLTEIGIGVLACFSDNYQLDTLDSILDHIGRVVTDSQASGGAQLPMETLSGGLLAAEPEAAPPPPPPAPEPVVEEAVIPIAEAKGGLLSVNDDDIGGLFDNIVADPTAHNDAISGGGAAEPAMTPAAQPAAVEPAQPAAAAQGTGKPLMSVDDDMMSDIFDNLLDKTTSVEQALDFSPPEGAKPAEPAAAESTEQAPPAAPAPEPAPAAAPAAAEVKPEAPKAKGPGGQQIKEFGRLSTQSAAVQSGEAGAIKAIGRQLIDVQAVENIIKAGEKREKMGAGLTTTRVISAARGEGIKALLTKIDGFPGVAGSLIVGNDGLVIASTVQGGLDKDLLGALCTAMHSHTELATKKLNMGKMRQIIFHATDKTTVLTAVAVGVLAVFVENHDLAKLDGLLGAIDQTVRG
jgi:predicted regulator of Ras-like GTPase activity (Roadblock/LC7/MglB family)